MCCSIHRLTVWSPVFKLVSEMSSVPLPVASTELSWTDRNREVEENEEEEEGGGRVVRS